MPNSRSRRNTSSLPIGTRCRHGDQGIMRARIATRCDSARLCASRCDDREVSRWAQQLLRLARDSSLMIVMTRMAQAFDGRWHGRGWGHPWLVLLFLALVGVGIGVALWAVLRASRSPQHLVASIPPPDPAMETLRLRFARGEIGADEYASRAAQLSGVVPPASSPPSVQPGS
jgi:uncharacterized membrane protein